MTTIMPQSELMRKAVAWISGKIKNNPDSKFVALVEKAAVRFNLSPKDVEFLQRFFKKNQD
ncbi:hypothetical protein SYK_05240 [Pseudodesulfovibrio nedwellii]|uniref:Uncharacterized protein n=1 Tax=Pseudodesulfovibrio nedwellii TaxID=2973072 RepID=A0ABM8AXB4_9BACT|nr:hypothetical protein [Pseudodesulfovibrio nedwellii]BDQ36164.1 hypothetical protein SYK_05240 [Pseudodesulfovibrio nedwellii]